MGSDETYHIRISTDLAHPLRLTDSRIGPALLDSARLYHERDRWNCRLFLLIPDHVHALLTFPSSKQMSAVIAAWKGYQAKHLGICWQGNYFDHRIRSRDELEEKAAYIRLNPVRKNLCGSEEMWPWVLSCAP